MEPACAIFILVCAFKEHARFIGLNFRFKNTLFCENIFKYKQENIQLHKSCKNYTNYYF